MTTIHEKISYCCFSCIPENYKNFSQAHRKRNQTSALRPFNYGCFPVGSTILEETIPQSSVIKNQDLIQEVVCTHFERLLDKEATLPKDRLWSQLQRPLKDYIEYAEKNYRYTSLFAHTIFVAKVRQEFLEEQLQNYLSSIDVRTSNHQDPKLLLTALKNKLALEIDRTTSAIDKISLIIEKKSQQCANSTSYIDPELETLRAHHKSLKSLITSLTEKKFSLERFSSVCHEEQQTLLDRIRTLSTISYEKITQTNIKAMVRSYLHHEEQDLLIFKQEQLKKDLPRSLIAWKKGGRTKILVTKEMLQNIEELHQLDLDARKAKAQADWFAFLHFALSMEQNKKRGTGFWKNKHTISPTTANISSSTSRFMSRFFRRKAEKIRAKMHRLYDGKKHLSFREKIEAATTLYGAQKRFSPKRYVALEEFLASRSSCSFKKNARLYTELPQTSGIIPILRLQELEPLAIRANTIICQDGEYAVYDEDLDEVIRKDKKEIKRIGLNFLPVQGGKGDFSRKIHLLCTTKIPLDVQKPIKLSVEKRYLSEGMPLG